MSKLSELQQSFNEALTRLEDALRQEKNEFMRDSAIQRFEFTFDLCWKTIKSYLETQGIRCASPKECFREAFQQGLIQYETLWLEMIERRNETVHTYNVEMADAVYIRLQEFVKTFRQLQEALMARE